MKKWFCFDRYVSCHVRDQASPRREKGIQSPLDIRRTLLLIIVRVYNYFGK